MRVAVIILLGILILILTLLYTSIAQAQHFVLYGSVELPTESEHFSQHQLSVQIGSHNWQQALKWRFYAFKVPQNLMSERGGVVLVSVKSHEELVKSRLWTHYFVIRHSGGALRLDIRIPPPHPCPSKCDAKPLSCMKIEGKAEEGEEVSYALVPLGLGDMVSYSYSYSGVCKCQIQARGRGEGQSIIIFARSMMMLGASESATTIEGKKHVCYWLRWLIIVFVVAQLVIRWLQSRICKGKSQTMMILEWGRGREEGRKRWEMSTYSTALNENENENEMNNNTNKGVLVSGEGTYEEACAWADAEHHLTKLNANCCFYFNSTTTTGDKYNSSHKKKGGGGGGGTATGAATEGEGPWNRDAFGRLIRLPPIIH